jgi:predicted lipid-binding transport protein (Tim44 family)
MRSEIMSKFFNLALAALLGLGLAIGEAEAKRLGGGKSIGKQREAISQPAPTTPPKAPTAAPGQPAAPAAAPAATPAPQSGMSKWLGPLAGLAAGTALGALLFGSGMGGLLTGLLMLAALAFGVVLLFRFLRRNTPSPHQAQTVPNVGYGDRTVREMVHTGGTQPAPNVTPVANSGSRPDWFEDETFLRAAKVHFIRLQDAWDKKDLNDIREYTTPEMFAELQQQIMEQASDNHTDVVKLDAQILDVITEGDLCVVSVHFSGQIREEESAPAQPFDEIWHVQKSLSQQGGSWYVAGIQQVQ